MARRLCPSPCIAGAQVQGMPSDDQVANMIRQWLPLAGVGTDTSTAQALKSDDDGTMINPRLFGFSSYLGPIVNLSFSDPSVLKVSKTMRIGSLRYPGGSTANSWNMSAGRWATSIGNCTECFTGGAYSHNTNMLPEGTYRPDAYMAGIGGQLQAKGPIWNLNMVSLPDPAAQLDLLKRLRVPVEMIELGRGLPPTLAHIPRTSHTTRSTHVPHYPACVCT